MATSGDRMWLVSRQVAGQYVKESRALRPRRSRLDDPWTAQQKNLTLNPPRECSLGRRPVDRMELHLALFGFDGWSYVLTFDEEPGSFADVRKLWNKLLYDMKKKLGRRDIDWVRAIECQHGDKRWHIHVTLRHSEFTLKDMQALWPHGAVEGQPLLLGTGDKYRRTAKYYTKERTDGVRVPIGKHTWAWSRCLHAKLPRPVYFLSDSGRIPAPGKITVYCAEPNAFGVYRFGTYYVAG